MTALQPNVVAIVLNWNAWDETVACLRSVTASAGPKLTVILVDNASTVDITADVAAQFPEVLVVRNAANLGFSGGMNTGMRRALELGAEYVLLLNNDTRVDEAMVHILVETATRQPDVGMVSPLVLFRDKPDTILSAGLTCDLRRGHQGRPMGSGQRNLGQFDCVYRVDAPAGAAMLVPADVIRRVGMLDEDLFLYGEDVEWAMRMQAAGLRIYVAPAARLWHGLSISSGGADSPLSAYYLTRNSFVVCARHAPLHGPGAWIRGAEILMANLYHSRRAHRPLANITAVLAGWSDYLRGRVGPARPGVLPGMPSQEFT